MLTLVFVCGATLALAQSGGSQGSSQGLVPCGRGDNPEDCSLDKLFVLIKNVLNTLIFVIAVPVATGVIVWAGANMVIFASNEAKVTEAKKALLTAVVGLALTLAAWLVIETILKTLTGNTNYF